ncbi:carboxymuconolactone decarboxylase family protein [Nocardioides anomalus]|uniref:Carboxymuconolactone decarboxylase family protein n=1 Tax=Nocardioides anomalus TaxID=2712223 RepID=A0A6G6WHJ1_9ACTN|nr:carboxymuconolactone decarboxylase family protein [Nocardioides anomalus]QIG44627.1 carboxymuconolactone decarboxylase family protein [Nocardioides anomalus]
MTRIPPASPDVYGPLFGDQAPLRQQVYANAPAIAGPYLQFMKALRDNSVLARRLVELVRLRISFHNQCRSCMAIRYADGIDDGLTEDLVCSLEKPQEADDLTPAERAALAFADKMATDHLQVDDQTFRDLAAHFTDQERMDLCFQVATFVGYGRLGSALAMTDDLPQEYADPDAVLAPWTQTPQSVV